jgi:DNA repair exonuclease SbcCD ATPase subunit
MPDIHTRTQTGQTANEPLGVVREQRIDPPHRLGDPPPDGEQSKVGVAEVAAAVGCVQDDIEPASLVVVQQLRSQAQQLAVHLQRQQADLDRREAELQAHAAQIEQQARNNRLWLKERHTELAEREAELRQREAGLTEREVALANLEEDGLAEVRCTRDELAAQREALERREADLRALDQSVRARAAEVEAAAAAVEDAAQAHDQLSRDLDRRIAEFDDRVAWCLDAISGFLERGELPHTRPHRPSTGGDAFDAVADFLPRLAQRRKNLDETEARLAATMRDMNQRRVAAEQARIPSRANSDSANETRLDAEQLLGLVRRILNDSERQRSA